MRIDTALLVVLFFVLLSLPAKTSSELPDLKPRAGSPTTTSAYSRTGREVPALIPGLAEDSSGNLFIARIDLFLNTCPASDPALAEIRNDFQIRRNGVLVGDIPCSEPVSQLPVTRYTDELLVLQGLRVIYYMDRGKAGHLPWTAGTLYNWMRSRIGGLNIKDGSGSFCCENFDGRTHVAISAQNDFNREFDKKWEGIAGNIDLYAHEARHVDGFAHSDCCGTTAGCDQTFDLNSLPPYGVQWWLNKAWLMGEINVGFGCLSASRVLEIRDWHWGSTDQFRGRLCENKPAVLAAPQSPGGACRTSCTANAASVSSASFLGPELAPDSIASAFGCALATTTLSASTASPPTELGGTRITVRDNVGILRSGQLFYVSPLQLNYLLPSGLAEGPATITVTNGSGVVSGSSIVVSRIRPGIFTANFSGQGLGATVGYRITANGPQGYFDTVRYDTTSQSSVAVPIDLGAEGDEVFLVLFGTGIRHRSSLSAVAATIGGTPVEVCYAGPQGVYFGLDQVNLLIPRSLAGRREVVVSLTVEGAIANPTTVNIK